MEKRLETIWKWTIRKTKLPRKFPFIEHFHSRDQQLCKFIGTKRKCLHKKRLRPPQDWLGTPIWPP